MLSDSYRHLRLNAMSWTRYAEVLKDDPIVILPVGAQGIAVQQGRTRLGLSGVEGQGRYYSVWFHKALGQDGNSHLRQLPLPAAR